jgi:gliding motility-associated protein GldC
MKKSNINFEIDLDKDNVPDKIHWSATDAGEELTETKSISISLWDHVQKNSMRIDLWTNDMPVDEMKRFYIDCLGGMAQSVLNSTGDEFMSEEMNMLCEKLVKHLEKEIKEQK